jgi:hypothetical protein
MADSKSADDNKPAPISVAFEEQISDEELDQALAEDDPEFLKSMQEMGQDNSLSLYQILITDEEQALNDEKDAWEKSGRLGQIIYKALPFIPRITLRLKKVRFAIFTFLRARWVGAKNFYYFLKTTGKKNTLDKAKEAIQHGVHSVGEAQRNFRHLNWKLKLSFFGIVALMCGTGFLMYRSWTHGILPTSDELFMPTMERVASKVQDYDPETETEPFYENLRASVNILLMPKMVVNLKRSEHSGENPMAAFEFYLEGDAPEVPIEVKDRETEIRDLMQRVVEGFTFDQVDSTDGKK